MSKTATKIKTLTGFHGSASLYQLDPPLPLTEYDVETNEYEATGEVTFVIVSAVDVPYSGPETYIFPATNDGEIADWGELSGSFKGGLDHAEALANAGYEVAS